MAERRGWGSEAKRVYSWARHCMNNGGGRLKPKLFVTLIKFHLTQSFVIVSMPMLTGVTTSRVSCSHMKTRRPRYQIHIFPLEYARSLKKHYYSNSTVFPPFASLACFACARSALLRRRLFA